MSRTTILADLREFGLCGPDAGTAELLEHLLCGMRQERGEQRVRVRDHLQRGVHDGVPPVRVVGLFPRLLVKTRPDAGHVRAEVFESRTPPGGGFPLAHVHDAWEEVFYVLEGEMEYRLGDDWPPAAAGSTICVPPGVVHAFRNSSDYLARHLVVHAPAAALELIELMAQTPRDQWAELCARYDSRLIDALRGVP